MFVVFCVVIGILGIVGLGVIGGLFVFGLCVNISLVGIEEGLGGIGGGVVVYILVVGNLLFLRVVVVFIVGIVLVWVVIMVVGVIGVVVVNFFLG